MDVFPKAMIAVLIGTVGGATVGVWSLGQRGASVKASAPAIAAPVVATTSDANGDSSSSISRPVKDETSSSDDDAHVVQRARTLARQPDVTGLMALRDDVVRRAAERGIAGSPSVKGELDAIDNSLNEARKLRLKLDAQELRQAQSKSTP